MKKNFLKILSVVLCLSLICGGLVFSASAETQETTGPSAVQTRISLVMNGDPKTSRGITWYTKDNSASVVEIKAASVDASAANHTINYAEVFEWEGNYVHKATLTGLTPGTLYFYRVGDGSQFSDWGRFYTDNGDSSFTCIAVADIQASSLENFQKGANTIKAAFDTVPTAEFMLNMGDFTNDSTNEEWDYYDEAMKEINLSTTLAPVAGNHDGLGVYNWFNNMFNLDTSESVQVKNGVNYSFDYGNAHFAILNTNDMLSISVAQLKWLENDMNGTDADWKIVCMHKSPYTFGKDGKWPDALYLQESLTKVLDKCGVDLVLSGHDHQYLRTKPLKNNKVNEDGTVYVLAGTAGTKRYEIRSFLANHFMKTEWLDALTIQKNSYGNYWDGEDWDQSKQTNVGGCFNSISVDGGKLTFNSYILADEPDAQGMPVITNHDSFTLEKEVGQNKITFTGDNTTSEAEYYLGAVPSFMGLATYAFCNWLPRFLWMLPDLLNVVINEGTF